MRTVRKKKPFIFCEISASLFQIVFPPFFSLAGRFRHVAEVAIILRKDERLAKFGYKQDMQVNFFKSIFHIFAYKC
jgi:hypothetical protein